MPELTSYAPGTPSWVDLGTPDLPKARAFYEALFGWEGEDQGEDAGHYTMERIRGLDVAAISPQYQEGAPPSWTTYITVDDADATSNRITDGGGTVLAAAFDVFDMGRMAVAQDPTGAFFSIWQPRAHIGARLVNEPGTLTWNELATRGFDAAAEFYASVFGWTYNEITFDGARYNEIQVDGRTVGGMMHMDDSWPAEIPPHWLVYFAVADTDASASRVTDLGGQLSVPPTDIPPGRFAVCSDPSGAVFSIIKGSQPPS